MNAYPSFDGTQSCAGLDTERFFADAAGNSTGRNADAKKVCRDCPFLTRCYDYAITHTVEGIWGGTTAKERDDIRRARRIVPVSLALGDFGVRTGHGSEAGAAAHTRRGEKVCPRCAEGASRARAERAERAGLPAQVQCDVCDKPIRRRDIKRHKQRVHRLGGAA